MKKDLESLGVLEGLVAWKPIYYRPLAEEVRFQEINGRVYILIPKLPPPHKTFAVSFISVAVIALCYGVSFLPSVVASIGLQFAMISLAFWGLTDELVFLNEEQDLFVRERRLGPIRLPSSGYPHTQATKLKLKTVRVVDDDYFVITNGSGMDCLLSSLSTEDDARVLLRLMNAAIDANRCHATIGPRVSRRGGGKGARPQ